MQIDVFLGTVMAFGFNFAPRGWMLCQGQLLSISQNTALFSLLGTTYGGNGVETFGLPNLQGRTIIGSGRSAFGITYTIGEIAGSTEVTLTSAQMPMHTHVAGASAVSIPVYSDTGNTANPSGNSLATPGASSFSNQDPDVALKPFAASVTVQVAGASQPVEVMNPYLVINYCMAT